MSKLLQKTLSAAIFPAALIIISKIIGMALANHFLNLDWSIQTNSGTIFSVQVMYPDQASAIACNSYSNLFMLLCLAIGVGVLLFQSHYLTASRQNPKVLVKLVQFDFLMWLSESSSIFPKLAVWIAFLWIVTILTLTQAIQGTGYSWVAIIGLLLSVVSTWTAARDFESELRTILPENGKLNTS